MAPRWRVDFKHGHASFSEDDYEKAKAMYDDPAWEAIRLRKCENIFDDGFVVEGMPLYKDLTEKFLSDEEKN